MRKRQFKKVLSLVLALAMVFTMNTSVFATGTVGDTDTTVVDTQPEAQPETPVNNETENPAPSEEPAAEPEAPAVETTPEPVAEAEAAPAPEADPEPAAGANATTINGWEISGDTGDGTVVIDGVNTKQLNVTDGQDITLTAGTLTDDIIINRTDDSSEATPIPKVTFVTNGSSVLGSHTVSVPANSSITARLGDNTLTIKDDHSLQGSFATAGGTYKIVYSGIDATPVNTTYVDFTGHKIQTGYSLYSVATIPEEYTIDTLKAAVNTNEGDSLEVYAVKTDDDTFTKISFAKAEAPAANYLAEEDLTVNSKSVVIDDAKALVGKTFRVMDGSEQVGDEKLGAAADLTFDGLEKKHSYQIQVKTASSNTSYNFESAWVTQTGASFTTGELDRLVNGGTATTDSYFELVKDNTVTVSGVTLKVESAKAGGTVISENQPDGIYLVTLSSGTVSLTGSSAKSVSFCAPEGTGYIYNDTAANLPGNQISFKGAGTVSFSSVLTSTTTIFDVESGLSLSANVTNGNQALIVSSGSVMKTTVGGEDEAITGVSGKTQVWVANKDATETTIKNITTDNYWMGEVELATAAYLLSGNKIKNVGAGVYNLNKSGADWALNYGKTVFYGTDAQLATTQFKKIPERNVSKFTATLTNENYADGYAIKNNGLDYGLMIWPEDVKKDGVTNYKFTLSTNSNASYDELISGSWESGDSSGVLNTISSGEAIKGDTTYYIYARRVGSGKYASEIKNVGNFKTLAEPKLTFNVKAGSASPNYIGDAVVDPKDSKKYKNDVKTVIDTLFDYNFSAGTPVSLVDDGSRTDEYAFDVNNGDGLKIGNIRVYFSDDKSNLEGENEPTTGLTDAKNLQAGTGAGKKYFARAQYKPDTSKAYSTISTVSSQIVSFCVVPSPVKVEPDMISPSVSGNVFSGSAPKNPNFKATNIITGSVVTLTGTPKYYIDGKEASADATSWNALKAGSYKITVSQGTLAGTTNYLVKKEDAGTDYTTEATLKVLDNKSETATVVELAQSEPLYYANTVAGAKNKFKITMKVDGDDVTESGATGLGEIHIYAASGNSIDPKKEITTDADLAKVSANDSVYVRVLNAHYSSLPAASSNMAGLKVTIAKRPVIVAPVSVKSDRNDEKGKVTKVDAKDISGTVSEDGYDTYSLTPKTFTGTNLVSVSQPSINLDPVRFDKSGDYTTTYSNLQISSNLATNYVLEGGVVNYHINRKYVVYYILEYNGEKNIKTQEFTGEGAEAQHIMFNPKAAVGGGDKDKMVSWCGTIKDKDNKLTNFKVYDSSYINKNDLLTIAGGATKLEDINYDVTADGSLGDDDYYLYATVTAFATKGDGTGVMVESIAPVYFDTTSHIADVDSKKASQSIKKDLDLVIYDSTKTWAASDAEYNDPDWDVTVGGTHYYKLQAGKDYTLSYKNNKNASVYFDSTTSGNGMDGSVHQINTDKKKWPQVVIKGMKNYKGMTSTIYFDIYPVDLNVGYGGNPSIGRASHTVADYYIVKKGKITYKNKVTNKITYNPGGGKPNKTKTNTLKTAKLNAKTNLYTGDYIETIQVNNKANGVDKWEDIDLKKTVFDANKEYRVILKGVNNYTGYVDGAAIPIVVVEGAEFSKLKFKALNPKWEETGIKPEKLVTVTNGKTQLTAEKDFTVGFVGGGFVTAAAPLMNAGKYTVVIKPTAEYSKANKLYGEKRLSVNVKGYTVKPTDILVNGQKALKLPHKNDNDAIKLTLAPSRQYSAELAAKYIKLENATYRDTNWLANDADPSIEGYDWKNTWIGATGLCRHEYTFTNTGNKNGGSYRVRVYLNGPFVSNDKNDQHRVDTSYTRLAPNLAKAVKDGTIKFEALSANANINGTSTDVRYYYKVDGKYVLQASSIADEQVGNVVNIRNLFDLSFKGVKAGKGAGTVTIAAKKNDKKYSGKATVKFDINLVKVDNIDPYNAASVDPANKGLVFAAIEDVISPNSTGKNPKNPKVTLYQINETGTAAKALKSNSDYKPTFTFTKNFVNNTVSVDEVTDNKGGYKGSFIFNEKKALLAGTFDAYVAKANKTNFDFTVSQETIDNSVVKIDAKGNVTATYTGNAVKPRLNTVTIDGKSYEVGADKYSTVSDNVIVTFSNNVKVGSGKMTVTLKRGANGYPVGGSKTITFKIVPQDDQQLILSLGEK